MPPKLLVATLRLFRRRQFLENSTHIIEKNAAVKEGLFTNDLSSHDSIAFVVTRAAYTIQLEHCVVVVVVVVQHSSNSSPNWSFMALTFCSQDTDTAACRLEECIFDDRSARAAAFVSCGAASSSRDDAAARGLA